MNRTACTQTTLYSLAFIGLGLITASLGPTLPALAAQTHASASAISRLFIARSLGTIAASLTLGKLYDRHTGHPVMGLALLAGALLMLAVPQIGSLRWLFLTFVCLGVASLVINVGGHTLLSATHGAQAALFINAVHFAFGLGGFMAPLIAKHFADATNALTWTYGVSALAIGGVAVSAWFAPSPAITPHHTQTAQALPPKTLIGWLILFLFLEVGAESIVSGWLFSYALQRGAAQAMAYDVNSAFWAAFTLGRLASIPLAWRISQRHLLLAHLSGWAALTATLLCLPAAPLTLWLCAVGMGLGMAPVFPTLMALGQRALRASGKTTGWLLFGAATGSMLAPWLVGQCIGRFGPQVFLWIILGELLTALLVILRFFAQAEPEEVRSAKS